MIYALLTQLLGVWLEEGHPNALSASPLIAVYLHASVFASTEPLMLESKRQNFKCTVAKAVL